VAERPLVSVVTTFLNAERFIQETIESVFSQSYDAWELLLVDDGSTDRSTAIAQSYGAANPGRVLYLEHEGHRNRGAPASRNVGIQNGRGKYVAFLDADDVWLPHKLERQVAIMESEPRAGMVYGFSLYWHSWTGAADDLEREWIPDLGLPTDRLFDPPELFRRVYPFGHATTPPPSDFLVRRSALESIGNFDEEFRGFYQLYEDQALLVKMFLNWPIFVSSEKWDKYRIHPDSCDSNTLNGGHYDSVRAFFLKWFQSWLSQQNIEDPDIWRVLRKAIQTARVQLRTAGAGVARILYRDDSEQVRIEIEKAGAPFDIQLNRPFYEVRANHRYAIRFRAKADRPRNIYAGIAFAHAPWTGIGMYRELPLRSDWEDFHLEFIATADDANARIHFDLGESDVPVDIGSLSVRLLPSERLVEPSLAPIPTDELFSR
jgi:glycosyltransferase involved in cell wall biosynthesis